MQKKRKWLWILCGIMMLVLALPVSAEAATTKYTLTGVAKPSTIKKGGTFTLKGKITCNKKMKEVRVTIYDISGKKCYQRYIAKPKSKTFDLANADPYIAFEKLNVGTYYLKVRCTVSDGKKFVVNKKFTVTGTGTIKVVNPKPAGNISINKGGSYAIGGKITSTYKLASVTASLINSSNKTVYTKTVKPNKTSYDVANSPLDDAMLFNKLAAGSYKYKLTAVDSQGKSVTLIYRTVTVKETGTTTTPGTTVTPGTIKVVNPLPASDVSFTQGKSYAIGGTITSTYKLTSVTAAIINSSSKTVYTKTVIPNTTSYKIANSPLDDAMLFNKLAAGTYKYKLTATDSQGQSVTLIYRTVTVTSTTTVTPGTIKVVNPVPASDVSYTQGKSYAIGGTITSTYKLTSATAAITDSSSKIIYTKTVIPNVTSYNVSNSPLDDAMLFDKLAAGTYKYKLTATDSQGQSVTLIDRTITVKAATSTTPGSTGTTPVDNTGNYLNTTGPVTIPTNYVPRTARPGADNKYYYNSTYNIYYKYNSLAPTGKPYYGNVYVLGNCTWYACGRAMEIVANAGGNVAKVQSIFGGDPVGIYNSNAAKGVFEYGTTPKIGALAIFNYGASGDAHIAVVENIINGVPYVSESGYTESATQPNTEKSNVVFQYQSIYNWAGGRSLRGYIYLV